MNTFANSNVSTRLMRGASRVFLEPVVDLERTRSRPKLVAALIGVIALSGACMSQNMRTGPLSNTATSQQDGGPGQALDSQVQAPVAIPFHVVAAG